MNDVVDKLLAVPLRENAGSRTANRFSYQQVWAFNQMIELLKQKVNFILFMEFHDDVIILENTSDKTMIDFYQIKTNDTKSRFITTSFITKDGDKYPNKMSIMQKMIDNYKKFSNETKGLHLVSNKFFDLGILRNSDESTKRLLVKLKEVDSNKSKSLTKTMCKACHLDIATCNHVCTNIIYFDVSFQDLNNYEETVMGKFISQLFDMGIESTVSQTKTLFYTILGEIKRANNCETQPYDLEDLKKHKSISSERFSEWISRLRQETCEGSWDNIRAYMLNDGFSSFEVNKISKYWKKCQIDLMNVDDVTLQDVRDEIRGICNSNEFTNAKEARDYIYCIIKKRKDIIAYEKEYIYTIIIRELYL